MTRLTDCLQVEEGGVVGDTGGLLHVMRHDHDGVVVLQLVDQILDSQRRNRVKSRARLIHQQHLRVYGHGAGDAQTLLLTAGKADARIVKTILDLVPQVGATQSPLDQIVRIGLRDLAVVELHASEHVLADGHGRERVRTLEHHADVTTHSNRVDVLVVQVLAFQQHLAFAVSARNDLVHAIERAQHRGLATAGRSDESGDLVGFDVDVHIFNGQEVAVVDVQMIDINTLSHFGSLYVVSVCKTTAHRSDLTAKIFATSRPIRLRISTMRISTRAAAHARSIGMVVTQEASAEAGQFALSLEYSW